MSVQGRVTEAGKWPLAYFHTNRCVTLRCAHLGAFDLLMCLLNIICVLGFPLILIITSRFYIVSI